MCEPLVACPSPVPLLAEKFTLAAQYRTTLEVVVPRLLGLMNRNPVSATWGCLDRNFWHYQTAVDFPSATFQQPVLALAWLYTGVTRGNPFQGNPALLEAAKAGLRFWSKIQHRDGSFDEFYQNEHSFCPTAFTTFAVSEALLVLGDCLSLDEKGPVLKALRRAGDWLLARDNPPVANQRMAALNALANIAALTADSRYRAGADTRLVSLLDSQHPEGWFPEYGGADIGYSFKALDLLGHYFARHGDEKLAGALERLLNFVALFVHPDGTAGGFYGSRNGAHVLPYGLELLGARGFGKACYLLEQIRAAAGERLGLTPLVIDDKYLAYFYANSYAGALVVSGVHIKERTPVHARAVVLEGAGLFRVEFGELYAVGSGIKGGCFKVYAQGRLLFQESGYFGVFADGHRFSSQAFARETKWAVEDTGEEVVFKVESGFVLFDDRPPLVRWSVPFKLFTRLVLRSGWLAEVFQRAVKASKVGARKPAPMGIERQVVFGPKGVRIIDTVKLEGSAKKVAMILTCPDATVTPSASTRYTALGDLTAAPIPWENASVVRALNETGSARIVRALPLPAA